MYEEFVIDAQPNTIDVITESYDKIVHDNAEIIKDMELDNLTEDNYLSDYFYLIYFICGIRNQMFNEQYERDDQEENSKYVNFLQLRARGFHSLYELLASSPAFPYKLYMHIVPKSW